MEKLKVLNPYSLEIIRELPYQEWGEIDRIVQRTSDLFKVNRDQIPKFKRIEILERLLNLVEKNFDELVNIAVSEGGKPLKDTKVEIHRALNGIRLCIEYISNMHGESIPMGRNAASQSRLAFTVLEPVGVVLAISAFNHPVNLIVHQVITAIAVGAPVIVKPALKTPLSCKFLVDLVYEAGLPVDWCQMIICKNELVEKMVGDKRISYVSFIGSHRVGWHLRSVLAPGSRIVLEHGGVAPVIIESDADIEALIGPLTAGAFYHAGQVCVSVQRIYVHDSVLPVFLEKFLFSVQQLKTGDPMFPDTDVGPLIMPEEVNRLELWVKDAQTEGAEILAGGKAISTVCFEPTVLLEPPSYSYVTTEEVFGPVVSIYGFRKRNEAIQKANSLPYSFQAAIYTQNINNALFYAKSLKANAVMINDQTAFRVDWMPFGGSELSGLGTGGIRNSMRDMCKEKLIVLKSEEL